MKGCGENWQLSEEAASRPWDPPLSAEGILMGAALGVGLKQHLHRLEIPPVSRIISSPMIRCLQTAAAAAEVLGIGAVAVEPGLSEGMLEDWYRSWAVPGADSTWGGPPHARVGTELPSGTELHASAHVPAHTLLHSPDGAAEALCAKGVSHISIDATYTPVAAPAAYQWERFETEAALAERMESTLHAIAARYPAESVLALSHGGPCGHAHRQLLKEKAGAAPIAGYTALYVFVRADDGTTWEAPLVADTTHLQQQAELQQQAASAPKS